MRELCSDFYASQQQGDAEGPLAMAYIEALCILVKEFSTFTTVANFDEVRWKSLCCVEYRFRVLCMCLGSWFAVCVIGLPRVCDDTVQLFLFSNGLILLCVWRERSF